MTSRGSSLVVGHGFLLTAASLAAKQGLWGAWALVVVVSGPSIAQYCALERRLKLWCLVACSLQDLPASGIKPMFLASAGGLFITEPPGKHPENILHDLFAKDTHKCAGIKFGLCELVLFVCFLFVVLPITFFNPHFCGGLAAAVTC